MVPCSVNLIIATSVSISRYPFVSIMFLVAKVFGLIMCCAHYSYRNFYEGNFMPLFVGAACVLREFLCELLTRFSDGYLSF